MVVTSVRTITEHTQTNDGGTVILKAFAKAKKTTFATAHQQKLEKKNYMIYLWLAHKFHSISAAK